MFMIKKLNNRTPHEKEKILSDIQRLGVTVGCRKHNLSKTQYYAWLDRYNAHGLAGLEDRRKINNDAQIKKLEKENRMLKELLAEKELESKMKDELLKKKFAQWEKKGK
jgi:putative transposase